MRTPPARRRGVRALATTALVVAMLGALAPTAGASSRGPAAPRAACTSTDGVSVLVDGSVLGTGVRTRCAGGDPTSGLAALSGAGFSYTPVNSQPFVCRIDGAPADDPCLRTPPANAYWSYWYAEPGGSWQYSNQGASVRNPTPGQVEGWAFGAGDPPSASPPQPPAPATTRATTTTRPTATTTPAPRPDGAAPDAPAGDTSPGGTAPPVGSDPVDSSSGTPTADSTSDDDGGTDDSMTLDGDSSTTAPDSPVVSTADASRNASSAGGSSEVAVAPASSTATDSGSGGAVVAIVIALGLAGAIAFELRRRRSPA